MTMLKAHLDKIMEAESKRRSKGYPLKQNTSLEDEQWAEMIKRFHRRKSKD